MSRFERTFAACAAAGRAALMPYVTAGDPSLEWTERLVDRLVDSGGDMIELGIPYSDPLADGPTVQAAGQRSLAAGTTIQGVFDLVVRLRRRHDVPIALLVYYNCIFRWGDEHFVKTAKESGVDGLIVPDLPPEEAEGLQEIVARHGLNLVYLLAPTSTEQRIALITSKAEGFIYCVSLTGVTGARKTLSPSLPPFIDRVRAGLQANGRDVPLVVGFGISTAQHVEQVGKMADGVIVASALIDRMFAAASPDEGVRTCGELISEMRRALERGARASIG